jgi:hypothetical protein
MKLSKVTRSKWKFPTRVVRQSQSKGELVIGSKVALRDIESKMGHPIDVVKTRHTPTQWRFYFEKRKN